MPDPIVVITGASGGIGAALARHLAADGQAEGLALVARRADVLAEVAAGCGDRALPIAADVGHRGEVRRVVREALAHFGRIDVWVNNVGQGISRPPSQLTDEDVDEMMRVNVLSALYGMQEVLPHFRARGEGQIVNISSMLGRTPFSVPRSAYSAAKHYLNALTYSFREELRADYPGIVFSLVSPGVVYTDFGQNARHGGMDSRQLPDGQSAEEVATVIGDVITYRRTDVYTRPGARERVMRFYAGLGEDP